MKNPYYREQHKTEGCFIGNNIDVLLSEKNKVKNPVFGLKKKIGEEYTHTYDDTCIKYLWPAVASGRTGPELGGWLPVHCVPFYAFSY